MREAIKYASLIGGVRSDDILLDIGANCGEVSRHWLNHGARAVAVEPNEELCLLMSSIPDLTLINAAVVGDRRATVLFHQASENTRSYIDDMGNPEAKLAANVVIKAVNFSDLVRTYRPTVVKCDTEGSEYLFASSFATLPAHVRALVLEWHGYGNRHCLMASRYDADMIAAGWTRTGNALRAKFRTCVRGYYR